MLSALALTALTIAAATPSSPAMATKLAEAIASSRGQSAAKVYVGAMPPGVVSPAPLPKFTLLGSVVTTPIKDDASRPTTPEVYYEVPAAGVEQALQSYRKQLEAAGWKASNFMQRFVQAEMPSGGFVVARVAPESPDLYCRTGGFVAFTRLRSMPDTVAFSFGSGPQVNAICALSAVMSAMPAPAPPPALPTLRAPSGVTILPMESGRFTSHISEPGSSESDATVKSGLPLSQIGAAFAQQLGSAGWNADPAAQSATAYAQTFNMTSKGHRLHAVLSLFATGKEQKYDAVLRAVDLDVASSPPTGFSFPFLP